VSSELKDHKNNWRLCERTE